MPGSSTPGRIAPPTPRCLSGGTLTATVTLRGAAAEKVIDAAGWAGKAVDDYTSDLVAHMVLLGGLDGGQR